MPTSLDDELDRAALAYAERHDPEAVRLAQQRRAALAYLERFAPVEPRRAY